MKKESIEKAKPVRSLYRKVTRNKEGKLRLAIVLAGALAAYAACMLGVYALYWAGYNALMSLWGVTARNVARAPWFVRVLTQWSGVLVTVLQHGLLIAVAIFFMRREKLEIPRIRANITGMRRGALIGFVSLMILWTALLLADNMRLGWSLIRPAWSVNIPALLITISVTIAGETYFILGFLYRFLRSRLNKWVAMSLYAAINAALCVVNGGINAWLLINHLLVAGLCALSYEKTESLAWAFGFRFVWQFMQQAILGFPGSASALYETYPVNHYWLSGGDSGLMCGAAATVVLLLLMGLFILREKRKSAA